MEQASAEWDHPGGKLIEAGADRLTNEELGAILIAAGYKGRTAIDISHDLFYKFYSLYGLLGKRPSDLTVIKGLKEGKIRRICAAYEMAKRIIKENQWNLPAVRKITLELPELSDAELVAVLIVTGYKDKTAVDLANELLDKFSTVNTKHKPLSNLMGKMLYDMAQIKGMGDVKVIRIAAALEVVRRLVIIIQREG